MFAPKFWKIFVSKCKSVAIYIYININTIFIHHHVPRRIRIPFRFLVPFRNIPRSYKAVLDAMAMGTTSKPVAPWLLSRLRWTDTGGSARVLIHINDMFYT